MKLFRHCSTCGGSAEIPSNVHDMPPDTCPHCHWGYVPDEESTGLKERYLKRIGASNELVMQLRELVHQRNDAEYALREFVEWMLDTCCWENNWTEPDPCTVQEKAEELKLIELRPIPPEDAIDGETEHYFCKWTPKTELQKEKK